jgi:hypothetical protein
MWLQILLPKDLVGLAGGIVAGRTHQHVAKVESQSLRNEIEEIRHLSADLGCVASDGMAAPCCKLSCSGEDTPFANVSGPAAGGAADCDGPTWGLRWLPVLPESVKGRNRLVLRPTSVRLCRDQLGVQAWEESGRLADSSQTTAY